VCYAATSVNSLAEKNSINYLSKRPHRQAAKRGKPVDERIEAFLADVLALEGEAATAHQGRGAAHRGEHRQSAGLAARKAKM
jgi:hypothetical protein